MAFDNGFRLDSQRRILLRYVSLPSLIESVNLHSNKPQESGGFPQYKPPHRGGEVFAVLSHQVIDGCFFGGCLWSLHKVARSNHPSSFCFRCFASNVIRGTSAAQYEPAIVLAETAEILQSPQGFYLAVFLHEHAVRLRNHLFCKSHHNRPAKRQARAAQPTASHNSRPSSIYMSNASLHQARAR